MQQLPLVSIVILTKNGGRILRESLEAILTQKFYDCFEVLIVDSGSTDGTLEFLKSRPVRLIEIKESDFSFGPTRDFAFNQTQGKYIVTLSQDVVPAHAAWLENLVRPLINDEVDVSQGKNVLPLEQDNVFFWEKKGCFYFTSEGKRFAKKYGQVSLSCTNFAVKREVWQRVGFLGAAMNEDKAFQKQAHALGFRMKNSVNAVAYHGHNYKLSSLIKRCENEGFGWKNIGEPYLLSHLLKDLIPKKWLYGILYHGLINREIRNFPELIYLILRPICLFKGSFFHTYFKK